MRAGSWMAIIALVGPGCVGTDAFFGAEEATETAIPTCGAGLGVHDAAWLEELPRLELRTSAGVMVMELAREHHPAAVSFLVDAINAGRLDNRSFHSIRSGFVAAATIGDATAHSNSSAGANETAPLAVATGGALRHDTAGVLSLGREPFATSRSKLFVTLDAAPHLDDRHTIVGVLVDGESVLSRLAATPAGADGAPRNRTFIESARIEAASGAPVPVHADLDIQAIAPFKNTSGTRDVSWIVIVRNRLPVRDAVRVTVNAPDGWGCTVTGLPHAVPAQSGVAIVLTASPPGGGVGGRMAEFNVVATSSYPGAAEAVRLRLSDRPAGPEIKGGSSFEAHVTGTMLDGRLFSTTRQVVHDNDALDRVGSIGGYMVPTTWAPAAFDRPEAALPGIAEAVVGARVGETVVARVAAHDAYPGTSMYDNPLVGRELLFEVELVGVEHSPGA